MKQNRIIILFILFIVISCSKKESNSEFITTEKGFKFKHCIENKTSPKINVGDIILGEIEIRQNDSILYSNFGSPNRLFKVNADTTSEFDKLLLNMHIGDSVIIEPPIDSIITHVANIIAKPKDKISFHIKVHQIISQRELTDHDRQVLSNQKIEDSLLFEYVLRNYPKAEKKPSGLYILEHKQTDKASAEFGKRIAVYYSVTDTTGRLLDSNKDIKPFEFELGDDGLIAGWTEGLSYMKEGERMKILIPSKIAYGESGYGAIAPYTPLIFDLHLVKVEE